MKGAVCFPSLRKAVRSIPSFLWEKRALLQEKLPGQEEKAPVKRATPGLTFKVFLAPSLGENAATERFRAGHAEDIHVSLSHLCTKVLKSRARKQGGS